MPLFMCTKCGCVENTAVCNYWANKSRKQPIECSECDPKIGQWHNLFPKKSAVGMLIDQHGYLWSKAGAASMPVDNKIIGEVA